MSNKPGVLYIVATPIGNLDDLSPRARQVLQKADWVACEDTRHSGVMLKMLGVQARLLAYHDHNEQQQTENLLAKLKAGEDVALISDAGTPLISDPGYRIVAAAHQQGIQVSPVPGPSALIAALSASGLPSDRFSFEGFLPAKGNQRRKVLEALQQDGRTLIFYESSHRIAESLADMLEVLGDRPACIARELTKTFETISQAKLADLLAKTQSDQHQQKGEFVVMVEGFKATEQASTVAIEAEKLLSLLDPHMPPKQVAKIAAELLGGKKSLYYAVLMAKKNTASAD